MKATEQVPSGSSTVYKATSPSQKEASYRCGLTSHKAADCHFKEATCHTCGKKGHINEPVRIADNLKGKEEELHRLLKEGREQSM